MRIVVLGLSLTSAWGNGHASTYRSLLSALARRGHRTLFLERDVPWYADNRDCTSVEYADVVLYRSVAELQDRFAHDIGAADAVIVGSYVPEGPRVIDVVVRTARGVTAFYDIDTPITMAHLEDDDAGYIDRSQVAAFDLYLSFTGGPALERLERAFGARRARPLYCSVDPHEYLPERAAVRWDLGYLGTYSADRAEGLDVRLLESARRWPEGRFVVAGAQFPPAMQWPPGVDRVEHIPPAGHRCFYASQRFTLNLTREAMRRAGYSPSVRLFEAAACGVPIISDPWPGLDTFFAPGREIFVSRSTADTLALLRDLPDAERQEVGRRARTRVLAAHTSDTRATELEALLAECR